MPDCSYLLTFPINPEIGKIMIKNIPFRQVFKIRFCGKFFCIVPGLKFLADGRRSGSYGKIQNYYL